MEVFGITVPYFIEWVLIVNYIIVMLVIIAPLYVKYKYKRISIKLIILLIFFSFIPILNSWLAFVSAKENS